MDAAVVLGFCHYDSSHACPDETMHVLNVLVPPYGGCAERQAMASRPSSLRSISRQVLDPFTSEFAPFTPTYLHR
jgi:hypothetical protein